MNGTLVAAPPTAWRNPNFLGGVWHGALLAASTALSDVTVVLPAFIHDLTGSSVWVGGLIALLAVSGALPQIFVARFVEPMRRKRPVLLGAIYLRASSLAVLGLFIAFGESTAPRVMMIALAVMLGLFAAGGALGNVPYTDLIGRVIPASYRGKFFASRQMIGSLLALASSALAGALLTISWPRNYAALFLVAALVLAVSSLGIWAISEPPVEESTERQPWSEYLRSLREPVRRLGSTVLVFWITGVSLLAVPFYIVAARRSYGAPPEAMALFIAAIALGAMAGNYAWGRLVDNFGSRRMLVVYVWFATATPVLGLLAGILGWLVLLPAAMLVGATMGGRRVGFQSALLEEAPASRRSSYAAVYALMGLPVAIMPLVGGWIAERWSFSTLFTVTSLAMLAAAVVVRSWASPATGLPRLPSSHGIDA